MRRTPPRGTRQRGFTLLEAMVALLVLSIGLLGLAALQAQGLRFNTDSYVRSQATFLAYDIIERMRTNADNAGDYIGGDPGVGCGAGSTLAEDDRSCWHDRIARLLPGGTANITGNVGGDPNTYQVTVTWIDRSSTQAPPNNTTSQSWTFVVTS